MNNFTLSTKVLFASSSFMLNSVTITCLLFFTSVFAVKAEIPKNPKFQDYAYLLNKSPFEIELSQIVEKVTPKKEIKYYLRGVTKLEDKWMVFIADRKKPKDMITLKQGQKNSADIELINVMQKDGDYKLTLATIKVNGQEMSIGYNLNEIGRLSQNLPQEKEVGSTKPEAKPKEALKPGPETIRIRPNRPTVKKLKN